MDELLTSFTMEKPNRESNPGTHGRHTGTSATLQRRPSPRTTATTRRHALRQLHGTASHAKRWPSSPSRSRPLMPNVRTGTSAALHPLILTQKAPSAGILNSAKENRGATEEKIDATAAKANPRHECRRGSRPCLQPNALRPDCQSEKPDGPDHQNETGGSDRKSADQKELRRQRSAHRPCAACIG